MQYLLLIYGVESHLDSMNQAEQGAIMKEFGELTSSLKSSGHYIGRNRLYPTAKATTVRIRDNKRRVTDGPFAETKEQLGSYYLVEAKDLDEALAMAARIPSARWGSVEVRPIFAMPS
jgi:hypothetical protein